VKDISIDIDDRITYFTLAGDLSDAEDQPQKIFMIEFKTLKGIHFRHGLSEQDVPETCIVNVGIKPDEYILGFFGNLQNVLDGFGLYILKLPVVSRKPMIECK